MDLTATDTQHLRRCIELAAEALEAGDMPFGSLLVDGQGRVLREARNRAVSEDPTCHPELEVAKWAAEHLTAGERAACTVYTSGEHCPMCAAAHAWLGLGRIVYAASSAQLAHWLAEWAAPEQPVAALSIAQVAPRVPVDGPAPELVEAIKALHRRHWLGGLDQPGR
jgi:tRNA(Arg) A34 adenosine deaminase TadA